MAIEKAEAIDKIVIQSQYNFVKLRTQTVYVEDGKTTGVIYSHQMLKPGTLSTDGNDTLVDRDISGYSTEIQGVCNAVWTDAIKENYRKFLVANKGG